MAGERRHRLARRNKLVARGDEGDARPAADRERAMPAGGGERDLRRADARAGADQHGAGGEVPARGTDMRAFPGRTVTRQDQPIPAVRRRLAACVLLHEDRVGTGRQRCAGEDADGLGRAHGGNGYRSGRALADDAPGPGQVGEADRITVHRRKVGGGLGAGRQHVARGPAVQRVDERRDLFRQRRREGEQAGLRCGEGKKIGHQK